MYMKELYLKSLQKIKELKIRDREEYIKIAKEENLLMPDSLEYISNKKFEELVV